MDIKSKKIKITNVGFTHKTKPKNNHRECFNSKSKIPDLKTNNYSKNVNSNNRNKSHQSLIKPCQMSSIKRIVHIYDSLSKTGTSGMPQKAQEIGDKLNRQVLINYLPTINDFSSQNQKMSSKTKVHLNMDGDHCSTENMISWKKRLIYEGNNNLDSEGEPDYETRLLTFKKRVLIINANYEKLESLRENLGINDGRTAAFNPIIPPQSSSVQKIVPLFVEPTSEMPTYNGVHDSNTNYKRQYLVTAYTTKLSASKWRLLNFFKSFYRSSKVKTNTVNPEKFNDVMMNHQLEYITGKSKSKRSWFSSRVLIKCIYFFSFVTFVHVWPRLYT